MSPREEVVAALEAAAGRGHDGTSLDGEVLFGDPFDIRSFGSAYVDGEQVRLSVLLEPEVAEKAIAVIVAGTSTLPPPADEDFDEEAWQARLRELREGKA